MARKSKKEEPKPPYRACDTAGCPEHAEFRAPKSREAKTDYHWFCLDHVRDYNKGWNYFDGMEMEEIESFMKDAVTGHRPTWYMGGNASIGPEKLRAALDAFMTEGSIWREKMAPPIDPKDKKALRELELEHPAEPGAIKQQYKKLVKALHPDLNPGDQNAEERFKRVTQAYRTLREGYAVEEKRA